MMPSITRYTEPLNSNIVPEMLLYYPIIIQIVLILFILKLITNALHSEKSDLINVVGLSFIGFVLALHLLVGFGMIPQSTFDYWFYFQWFPFDKLF